jgi:two-component system phosphate regulon sensor histidine kinase PhoR
LHGRLGSDVVIAYVLSSKTRNIAIALGLLFILPAALLVYRELRSLNEFESTLSELYKRQLDAVLYSVNQYSQDLTDSWVNRLQSNGGPTEAFFQNTPSVSEVWIANSLKDEWPRHYGPTKGLTDKQIIEVFESQQKTLKRLAGYLEANYRKLEPVSLQDGQGTQGILFLINEAGESPRPCLIVVDAGMFIGTDLKPRLDLLAQDDFDLFVWKTGDNEPICATDTISTINILEKKPLWLLPDYEMAINLRGENLGAIVRERSSGSLGLIIGLNVLVLLGVVWLYRTIRKEVQLAQTRSDFVSNVSHEIRTPLALISMFAETLMLKRVPNEERRDTYYRIIFQESKRLTGLVNKILNFSQMEAGQRRYQMEEIDLNALAKEIWEAYEFHLSQQGFETEVAFYDGEILIQADREAISEAIINLLDNAMKYSPSTKFIKLQTNISYNSSWVEVMDEGMGIPHDQVNRIFEKFHRVASGPIHNTKGTGLGLTLVKRIMEDHEGDVEVGSEVGKGSSFKLVFRK